MLDTTLVKESLSLMAIGMGTVFSFLLLLVLLLRIMSWLAHRLSPLEAQTLPATPMAPMTEQAADAELIAVITAAVTRYRSRWRP
ncbi:OadG family protein [Halochromatium salexigens]|uniref:Probable oxaloacetate decarboxylase gamma chain n=1 Tax=Halochromatium salexigens TaxID=49447 RepID=A0AAJ0UDQ5_HALSE|nr:OadG family protein [Halochromatium salexigens]MBK5929560.1 hypothetical protein [Halochromatium salexigens]